MRDSPMRTAAIAGVAVGLIASAVGFRLTDRQPPSRRPHAPLTEGPTGQAERMVWAESDHPLTSGWRRVPIVSVEDASFGARSAQVIDGLLVTSSKLSSGCCDNDVLTWQSADGETWVERTTPDEPEPPRGSGVHDVAVGHGLHVAVGTWASTPPNCSCYPIFASAWFSVDGRHWTQAPTDPAVFGLNDDIEHVWVTPSGFAAVGLDRDEHDWNVVQAGFWTSNDGRTWTQLHGVEGPRHDRGGEWAVAKGPTGAVVLTPTTGWRTVDGVQWTKTADFPPSADGQHEPWQVFALGNMFAGLRPVRSGSNDNGPTATEELWLSTDGGPWERVGPAFGVLPSENLAVSQIRPTPLGYIALGGAPASTIWISTDARSWQRVPDLEQIFGGYLNDVVAFKDRLIIFGGVDAPTSMQQRTRAMTWVHALEPPT